MVLKLRAGSFLPALLERRRRIGRALLAVLMEAYVSGTCVRKVDDLVKALGPRWGIFRSGVSRIRAALDATYCTARAGDPRRAYGRLNAAMAAVMIGSSWQRCRVHFLREVLAPVPKASIDMVAAAIRVIVAQPDAEHVRDQLGVIAAMPSDSSQGRGLAPRGRR